MRRAAAAAFRLLDLEVAGAAAARPGSAASFGVLRGCGMVPVGERTVLAPARGHHEPCLLREVARPTR